MPEYMATITAVATAQATGQWCPRAVVPQPDAAVIKRAPCLVHRDASKISVIRVDWVDGVPVDEAMELERINLANVAESILRHHSTLHSHGWCRVTFKLATRWYAQQDKWYFPAGRAFAQSRAPYHGSACLSSTAGTPRLN